MIECERRFGSKNSIQSLTLSPRSTRSKTQSLPSRRLAKCSLKFFPSFAEQQTAELLRLLASFCKRRYSFGKARKIDDNVIRCEGTRIQVVGEIKVDRFHALGFSVL
jgi:hypothetical protein